MTLEEVISFQKHEFVIPGKTSSRAEMEQEEHIRAKSFEMLMMIKAIIDLDNGLVQDDASKYKMICEVIDK